MKLEDHYYCEQLLDQRLYKGQFIGVNDPTQGVQYIYAHQVCNSTESKASIGTSKFSLFLLIQVESLYNSIGLLDNILFIFSDINVILAKFKLFINTSSEIDG